MDKIYRAILTIIVCLFLACTITASDGSTTMDIYYGIQLTVDGQYVTLTDANGNVVYPFTSNGTTYVPIRAVSEYLGAGVTYNAETKTAHIFSKEVIENYQKYGTVTSPETQDLMTQEMFDIFKLVLKVESCIDEYNYIDYNINGVLYKYILDENDALDYIDELRNHIDELNRNTIQDISSWVSLNFTSYSFETGRMLRELKNNLNTAFSEMDEALDYLSNYIDPISEIMRDMYYNQFDSSLSNARKAAIACSSTCDSYIDVYIDFFDNYIE